MEFSYNLDFRELSFGLTRLNLKDNIESFIVENVVIAAGAEKQLTYKLPEGKAAKYFISLGQTGNGLVTKGSTAWTTKHVYIKNNGAEEVTISLALLGA